MKSKVYAKNLFKYTLCFIVSIVVGLFLGSFNDKQIIQKQLKIESLKAFFEIIFRNSISFVYILLTKFTKNIALYIMLLVNGLHIGLLSATFMYIEYLILLVPHGIPEFTTFIMLAAFVTTYRDELKADFFSKIKPILGLYVLLIISAVIEAWVTPLLVYKILY